MNEWVAENMTMLLFAATIAAAVLLVLAIVFLALWLSERRRRRRLLRQRGDAMRDRIELELSLREQAGRLLIVRELQDVAIQTLSRLITRAEGARYAAEADPATAVRSAVQLVDDGRVVLGDMRRVVTLIREGEVDAGDRPPFQSARDLFHSMRDAGLLVTFEESGERFPLKPGPELTIFRILQVALSNALRHGGEGTEAHVTFTWVADGLQVVVDDDGVRAAVRRDGRDPNKVVRAGSYSIDDDVRALTETLTGADMTEMREHARLFGGVLHAHAVPGVGFSVSAMFPGIRFHNGVHAVDLNRK